MIQRYLVPLMAAVALFAVVGSSQSSKACSPTHIPGAGTYQSEAAYREAIRRMPLMERPDRPGHFIGNTLRGGGRLLETALPAWFSGTERDCMQEYCWESQPCLLDRLFGLLETVCVGRTCVYAERPHCTICGCSL